MNNTNKKPPSFESGFLFGAGGGGRTRTSLRTRDFESRASANSTTPAYGFYHNGNIIAYRMKKINIFSQKNNFFLPKCIVFFLIIVYNYSVKIFYEGEAYARRRL